MRTVVMRAVSEPQQIFWAPLLPAGCNVFVNISLMILCIVLFDINPLPFFVTTIIGHAVIAGYGLRDPHLSSLMAAWAEKRKKTVNLIATKGNKFVP